MTVVRPIVHAIDMGKYCLSSMENLADYFLSLKPE